MITQFKIFEKLDDGPKIGDYVICEKSNWYPKEMRNFISTNIGTYIKYVSDINDANYLIAYENAPDDVAKIPSFSTVFVNNKVLSAIRMHKSQILHFSNKKEDMKLIINTNKYNL